MLSPPCQPFTQGGARRDDRDTRSVGLLHLVGVLHAMQAPPRFLFVENVPNFEASQCHKRLVDVLRARGYHLDEFLVSPCDPLVGIPNNRRRYYLAARQAGAVDQSPYVQKLVGAFAPLFGLAPDAPCRPLRDFLDDSVDGSYAFPAKYIDDYKNYRHGKHAGSDDAVDVVHPEDRSSTTFTKAYGSRYIIGTGSVLQTRRLDCTDYAKDDPLALQTLGLRFFTEAEIARLHGFPVGSGFAFPESVSRINRYRLLGNSLNVHVVALVLRHMLCQ